MIPVLLLLGLIGQALALGFAITAARYAAAAAADAERSWAAEPGAGEAAAEHYLDQFGGFFDNYTISVTSDGDTVTATVTGEAIDLLPIHSWMVSRAATGQVEQFTEAP